MNYRIALGTADDAQIVEHEADGGLAIGDEVSIDGVMWLMYKLAPFEPGREVDFIAALAAPPIVLTLDGMQIEVYRSEFAKLRPEVAKLTEARGEAAAEALSMIKAVLENDQVPDQLSDGALGVISEALQAIEISDGLSDRLRVVWNAIRDHLAKPQAG